LLITANRHNHRRTPTYYQLNDQRSLSDLDHILLLAHFISGATDARCYTAAAAAGGNDDVTPGAPGCRVR